MNKTELVAAVAEQADISKKDADKFPNLSEFSVMPCILLDHRIFFSGKAWIPAKNVEKLSLSVAQTEEKKRFLRKLFAFQI